MDIIKIIKLRKFINFENMFNFLKCNLNKFLLK